MFERLTTDNLDWSALALGLFIVSLGLVSLLDDAGAISSEWWAVPVAGALSACLTVMVRTVRRLARPAN